MHHKSSEGDVFNPINFFPLTVDCHKGTSPLESMHALYSTAKLTGEKEIAKLFLGWSTAGIAVEIFRKKEELKQIELFFDTRSIKTAIFNHKFCHHFLFTRNEEGKWWGREITRFRTEDSHPLCPPDELSATEVGNTLTMMIPSSCLHGYDPDQYDRIGFTYRLKSCGDNELHFTTMSDEFNIDQNPALWATMRLQQ